MGNEKIAIVTDSTSDIPDAIAKREGIRVIPLRIVYTSGEYRDRTEITPQSIYDNLENEVPKSTLPLAEDVIEVFDKLKSEGYEQVLVITIASSMSGTYNLISLLAQEYEGMDIQVIDSCILSMGLGFMALEAARAVRKTGSVKAAIEHIKRVRKDMLGLFVVKTLKYLKLGGRIGRVSATIGSMLSIKPIIGVDSDGVYTTVAKARGRRHSIDALIEQVRTKFSGMQINLAVLHGNAYQEAVSLYNRIADFAHVKLRIIEQVSPVLGLHSGPGLLGVVVYEA